MSYFHSKRKGDIISVISNDLNEVENSVVNALIVVAREPFTIVGFFVLLFSISVKLTLFSILVLPLSFLLIAEVIKRLKKSAREGQQILGNLTSVIDETLSGIKVIQAFVSEKFMFSRFATENKSLKATTRKVFYKRELASPLSEFLGVSVITVLLFYGGSIVLSGSGELSGSEFIAYLVLYSQILSPAKNISNTFTQIQKGIVSGERIFSILDQPLGVKNKENPIHVHSLNTSVTLKNVGFAYNPEQDRWALRNVDLIINKGQTVALVGQSGSGKSTLAELLLRFYDPVEGTIEIDGLNYKDVSKESLRSLTGMVTQEPFLFNDTIFNNIAFGWPEASEEKVIEASKIANAHDFIVQTELGYQTIIGDRGVKLSGGQRQRLSIARAVLRNPELLILDEATSALDSESERLVQDAINKIMKNRTAVVIAHRLSTIKNADLIVVLKDGLVIETGTHAQLIEQNGYYQKLINLQSFN
jgi:subfamily B ATP-binding cassette protein MsbA